MNSLVKRVLDIPDEVVWVYTNRDIYNAMAGDIMRSVTDKSRTIKIFSYIRCDFGNMGR